MQQQVRAPEDIMSVGELTELSSEPPHDEDASYGALFLIPSSLLCLGMWRGELVRRATGGGGFPTINGEKR